VSKLSSLERRSALTLACVISLRLFGLFLIMPVFSLYAQQMPDATPWLIGMALGVYGLGQVLLQIPLGLLSDRIGRKPAITLGLLVFAAGGLVAAMSHTLSGIVIGRALQGMGAVAGAGTALAADLTRHENRGKVMGIIGVSIGVAFLLALILGPPLEAVDGLPGLFAATSVLALVALVLLWLIVPTPERPTVPASATFVGVLSMLRDGRLLVLNGSVFFLHMLLTASFVGLPLLLPSLVEVGSLLFANAAAAYATPFALSGTSANVLAVRIAALVSGDIFSNPGLSSLLALLMFVLLVLVIGGASLLARWLRGRDA